ncbi:unnamed protein product [Tenebrio molitor]|nr:unnamed protein product [Tenebrio molitor]
MVRSHRWERTIDSISLKKLCRYMRLCKICAKVG